MLHQTLSQLHKAQTPEAQITMSQNILPRHRFGQHHQQSNSNIKSKHTQTNSSSFVPFVIVVFKNTECWLTKFDLLLLSDSK